MFHLHALISVKLEGVINEMKKINPSSDKVYYDLKFIDNLCSYFIYIIEEFCWKIGILEGKIKEFTMDIPYRKTCTEKNTCEDCTNMRIIISGDIFWILVGLENNGKIYQQAFINLLRNINWIYNDYIKMWHYYQILKHRRIELYIVQ